MVPEMHVCYHNSLRRNWCFGKTGGLERADHARDGAASARQGDAGARGSGQVRRSVRALPYSIPIGCDGPAEAPAACCAAVTYITLCRSCKAVQYSE